MGKWFDRVFREDSGRRSHWSCDLQEEEELADLEGEQSR